MKRRDFIKTSACVCCAGLLATGIPVCKNLYTKNHPSANDFLYKNAKELPKRIRIDICNLCQLNCVECWIRKNEEKIKKEGGGFGYVSFETYKDFIDKHPFIKEIELSCNGEIFLNPDLDEIIRYSHEKGITLTADGGVNLNTLSEKTAEHLVKYKFKELNVSIDGASPETYAIYRRGGDFNTVINNIKMINKYKEKYNSKYPKLTYKMILFGHNEHEIEKAKELAKSLNMEMLFDFNYVPEYSPVKDVQKVKELTGIDLSKNPYTIFTEKNENWIFCKDIYNRPQINWNGDLFGCCYLYIKGFGINVFKDGLLNALNNEKYRYAKRMLSDFSTPPRKDIPCTNCYLYSKLKELDVKIRKG